jgi:hypothetical protein
MPVTQSPARERGKAEGKSKDTAKGEIKCSEQLVWQFFLL